MIQPMQHKNPEALRCAGIGLAVGFALLMSALAAFWPGPRPAVAETLSLSAIPAAGPAREEAILDLLAQREQALALVRSGLAGDSDRNTLMALALAVEMGRREFGPDILVLLDHPNPRVCRRAALSLGRLRYVAARPEMERLLAGQPDTPLARALICGLGLMGEAGAASVLSPFLNHSEELVRVDAAAALAALGRSRGLGLVLEGSCSPDRAVRLEAVYGLRYFDDPRAGARLEEMASDPGEVWRREAAVSLAARELAGMEDAAGAKEAFLAGLLNHSNLMVRLWAVRTLADLGTPEAFGTLRSVAGEPTRTGLTARRRLLARGVAP